MRDRTFGVEIEHGHDYGYGYVDDQLRERFPRLFDTAVYPRYAMTVGDDGSGVEVRVPPLKGTAGFRTLRAVMEYLTEIGGWVSNHDGMHVHFGAEEFVEDPSLVSVLMNNWLNNERLIEGFVGELRRGRGSCPRVLAYTNIALLSTATSVHDVYRSQAARAALNIRALREHGTFEIRLHEGTLDPDTAEAWIRFCIKFIDAAARGKTIRSCNTPEELFREVPTYHLARKQLLSRALVTA